MKEGAINSSGPLETENNSPKPLTKFGSRFEESEKKWANEKEFMADLNKIDTDALTKDMAKSIVLRFPEVYFEIQSVVAMEDFMSTALLLPPEAGKLKDTLIRIAQLFNNLHIIIVKSGKKELKDRDFDHADAMVDLYKIGECARYLRNLPRKKTDDIKEMISSLAFKSILDIFKKYSGNNNFAKNIILNLEKELSPKEEQ